MRARRKMAAATIVFASIGCLPRSGDRKFEALGGRDTRRPSDETFDIGIDTRTGVDDSYKLPFRFTGTINKLTFKLGPELLTAADQKAAAEAVARAKD